MNYLSHAEVASMRDTVENVQLEMHCTIQRDPGTGGIDDFGQPIVTPRVTSYDGICHYWTDMVARGVTIKGGEIENVLPMGRVVLPTNADVQENDQVVEILGVDGINLLAAPQRVRVVVRQIAYTVAVVYERIGED